jgi:hypothetical protein
MKTLGRFLIGQGVLALILIALFAIVLGKVPGVYKATAPVLCPSAQPDALVVEYYEDIGNAVGTSHTLLCIGPDGDITEVGSWKPLGLVTGTIWLGMEALVLPLQIRGIIRRRRNGGEDPTPRPPRPDRRIQLGVGING